MVNKLLSYFPKEIDNFVDVFAGSGIVSAAFKSAKKYYLNDYNPGVYLILNYLWNTDAKQIINDIDKIIKKYKLEDSKSKDFKKNYKELRESYNKAKTNKDPRKLYTLVILGFNQQIRFNSTKGFNIPAGKQQWNDYQRNKTIAFVNAFKAKPKEIHNQDFEDFVDDILEKVDIDKTIFYFDPPYLLSNATYNDLWNKNSEKRLIELIKNINRKKGKVILSNVIESKGNINNELVNLLKVKNFNKIEVNNVSYSNSNYQRKKEHLDREVIIKNYE